MTSWPYFHTIHKHSQLVRQGERERRRGEERRGRPSVSLISSHSWHSLTEGPKPLREVPLHSTAMTTGSSIFWKPPLIFLLISDLFTAPTQPVEPVGSKSDWRDSIFCQQIPWEDQNQHELIMPLTSIIRVAWFTYFLCAIHLQCCPKTIKNTSATLLHWVACSFTTMNTHTVVYVAHTHHPEAVNTH